MRSLIVASFMAVMLMLFVAAVTDVSHDGAATQTVLMAEVAGQCGLDGCTHDQVVSYYEAEVEIESRVLKLPIESAESASDYSETMSLTHATVRHDGLRPGTVLKLPHYAVGQPEDSDSAASMERSTNVGA